MEEICKLNADRWEIVLSTVEPGTLEHKQGARHAITAYCDGKSIVAFAFTGRRRSATLCVEDHAHEEPDFVDFVLSERDLKNLEFLLTCAHQFVRNLSVHNTHRAGGKRNEALEMEQI